MICTSGKLPACFAALSAPTSIRSVIDLYAEPRGKYHVSGLYGLLLTYPVLGEAYKYKEGFFDAFTFEKPDDAIEYLEKWCKSVNETSLTYMKKFVNTLKAHWSGIITNFTCPGVNNGILEGINQKIQLAKRRARGFALISNFINMAYFVCGELKFDYP